jgi:uncharacterized damage-inducible protein DinB
MNARDLLMQQMGLVYGASAANVDGMTQEDSLVRPSGGGNCANWILGHLVSVHNDLMKVAGADPVWEDEQLARAGFEPIEDASSAIDWDTLRERFFASRDRCLEAIGRLSDEALAEPMQDPFGRQTTRGGLLGVLAFHQTYHVGQLGLARRFAGREGAILAPGQTRT